MLHNILLGIPMGPHFRRGRSKKLSLYKVLKRVHYNYLLTMIIKINFFKYHNLTRPNKCMPNTLELLSECYKNHPEIIQN